MISRIKNRVMRLLRWILKDSHSEITSFYEPRTRIIDQVNTMRREVGMLLTLSEGYQLHALAKNTQKVPGDIAEVGCFRGGSTRLIGLVKGNRAMHVFDTFEGLPQPTGEDGKRSLYQGQFSAQYEEVKTYLSDIPNVHLYKGLFPSTGAPIQDKRFSLVHLDLDLYQATKESLEFFYPRTNPGGVIVSHDYTYEGVQKAFTEFFIDKPEAIIETATTQALVVKL